MALTKVRGGGVDNPLTLGGGSASDRSIIFDGNAQDFHIGLDDSADSLTIGLGSTLGTTSHMVFDSIGAVTKPLQPAFLATPSSAQSSLAVQSNVTIVFGTEVYDQNGDFASNTFTAPVTGKYHLSANISFSHLDQDADFIGITLITSNRNYAFLIDPEGFDKDISYMTFPLTVVADMDASDTAYVVYYQSAGANSVDVSTGQTSFSGCLLA